jgi:D-alanyl-D-alanine carboxypeptidase/D-alanyl-D-alanine-endopeptidase (penicillin-binding protein 4)
MVDGSGLSKHNRVSPRVLVEALQLARGSFAVGPELVAALPIGARDGTLKKRADAAGERVRAKTGLLDGVTGLSGYAELSDGRDVVFSILVNGYRAGDEAAMGAVDGFVAALVNTPLAGIATGRAADRAAWTP